MLWLGWVGVMGYVLLWVGLVTFVLYGYVIDYVCAY